MAEFNPSKKSSTDFNGGQKYKAGDAVQASAINNLIESALWSQNNQSGGAGGGSTVVANPTLAGNETELTGLSINGTNYKIPTGYIFTVTENEDGTVDLTIEPSDNMADELAGTWLLNNIIDLTESNSWNVKFYFFKENGVDKVYGSKIFVLTGNGYSLAYSTQIGESIVYSNGWKKESYQLITITSKLADVGNGASLLSLLKANGKKRM